MESSLLGSAVLPAPSAEDQVWRIGSRVSRLKSVSCSGEIEMETGRDTNSRNLGDIYSAPVVGTAPVSCRILGDILPPAEVGISQ